MMKTALFIAITMATTACLAQLPSWGKCPKVKTQETFDINKYLGYWYEIEVFPTFFEKGKCTRARYSLKPDGHIEVYNRGIENGKDNDITGDAFRPDAAHQGQLKVRFSESQPYGDYWVVHTDYDHYTLVYSCGNLAGLFHIEMAWILARNSTLDAETTNQLREELASYGVDVSKFKVSDQSGCPP